MPPNFFKRNAPFFITASVVMLLLAVLLTIWPKPAVFVMWNAYHHPVLDYFFRFLTILGDGWFVIVLAIALFFARRRSLAFLIVSSYVLSGFVVQVIKNWFPEPRPAMYLQLHKVPYEYFIEGVTLHNHYSFPSGHTTSAFALAAAIAFMSGHKQAGPFWVAGALLVGYSRVYLGQHFPEDVIAGMALGIGCCVLCYLILGNLFEKWQRRLNRQPPQ